MSWSLHCRHCRRSSRSSRCSSASSSRPCTCPPRPRKLACRAVQQVLVRRRARTECSSSRRCSSSSRGRCSWRGPLPTAQPLASSLIACRRPRLGPAACTATRPRLCPDRYLPTRSTANAVHYCSEAHPQQQHARAGSCIARPCPAASCSPGRVHCTALHCAGVHARACACALAFFLSLSRWLCKPQPAKYMPRAALWIHRLPMRRACASAPPVACAAPRGPI